MKLEEFQGYFNPHFEDFFTQKAAEQRTIINDNFIVELLEYLQKIALQGGKRIRPYVAYLMYRSAGGRDVEKILPYLLGIELFHIFCLVHDDVIDHGKERHGILTAHMKIEALLRDANCEGDISHNATSQAILLGDLLYAWTFELFSASDSATQAIFFRMVNEVVLGQMMDVNGIVRERVAHDYLVQKMLLKTARYTFVRPMQIGVSLAGGSDPFMRWCAAFGEPLGVAFQAQDDLLDLTATSKNTKKTAMSDIREHQHTLFTHFVLAHGSKDQQQQLHAAWGNPLLSDESGLLSMLEESGAISYGRGVIEKLFADARMALAQKMLSQENMDEWKALFDTLVYRKS